MNDSRWCGHSNGHRAGPAALHLPGLHGYRGRVKRLRGRQDATYRLRVGDHRVFYDVLERHVVVTAVLHERETAGFYREEERWRR
ncbi:MAG: type II toxin-antitoxin system RelE family toxin [Candidatus Rokuibacteriota bacterium]